MSTSKEVSMPGLDKHDLGSESDSSKKHAFKKYKTPRAGETITVQAKSLTAETILTNWERDTGGIFEKGIPAAWGDIMKRGGASSAETPRSKGYEEVFGGESPLSDLPADHEGEHTDTDISL